MRLRQGLHCQIIDGISIFLDVNNGRYFMLRGELAKRFEAFAANCATPDDVRILEESQLLVDAAPSILPDAIVLRATRGCLGNDQKRPANMLVLQAIAAQIRQGRHVVRHRFADVIVGLRQAEKPDCEGRPPKPGQSEEAIAAAFFRAQRVIPSIDKCLPRSLAVAEVLRRHGHSPTVVFGVQFPFAAHCWVQCGACVVGDTLERARTFTPIFAV